MAWTLLNSFTEENWIHIMRVLLRDNNYTSTELGKRIESVIFPEDSK